MRFLNVLLGCEYAGDGICPAGKYAGDGRKRGSLLVSLAIRSNTTDKEIKQQGLRFFNFLFGRPLSALSIILLLRHTGWTGG